MPKIFLSAKLSTLFDKSLLIDKEDSSESFRASWNAHLFSVNRRKCIIVMNKQTLYSVILLGIVKKDMEQFAKLFYHTLITQLTYDNLYDNQEKDYWAGNADAVMFAKTDNDKKVIGSMNDCIFQLKSGITKGSELLKKLDNLSSGNYLNSIPIAGFKYKTPAAQYRLRQKDELGG